MNLPFFLQGLLIGVSIAAPVGPIGVLCIRRTITYGRVMGFLTGGGAATADAFYGAVAAFGLTSISTLLINYQDLFRLVGGIRGVRSCHKVTLPSLSRFLQVQVFNGLLFEIRLIVH